MVQETRYSLLSDFVSLVQQRLDDHASTMEIISRRLEQLDSNFRGMQAMIEERLPALQQQANQGEVQFIIKKIIFLKLRCCNSQYAIHDPR